MTGSGRPSPEPLLKKKRPQPYWGGDNSGNALEASNALNYRVWGIPAVLSTGIPGNALRAFPGSFRNFSGISSGKSQPYWGYGPMKGTQVPLELVLGKVFSFGKSSFRRPWPTEDGKQGPSLPKSLAISIQPARGLKSQ